MEEMKTKKPSMDVGSPFLKDMVKELKKLVGGELHNRNQCKHLVDKLDECMRKIQILIDGCARKKFDVVLKELFHIVIKVKRLLEDCVMKDDWCQVAMTLIGNVESYRELLIDLECVFQTMRSICRKCHPDRNMDDLGISMDFFPLVGIKLEEDQNSIFRWLMDMEKCSTSNDNARLFANYLCKWIQCLQKVDGGELDSMVYPDFPCNHCCLRCISNGGKTCNKHPEVHGKQVGEGGQPRMLITLDENLKPLPVPVRVGQAVDVVGQAGRPKTITGFQTHTTPVILATGDRAELATEKYIPLSTVLEGFVILKLNPDYQHDHLSS